MTFEINIWLVRLVGIFGVGIIIGLVVIGVATIWRTRKGFEL